MTLERQILTVGHSTHPIDGFLALLRDAGVEAIADVRRFPASRRNPQFGGDALAARLGEAGIAYHGLGEGLGGRRSTSRTSPNDGWRVAAFRGYADHMASAEFQRGLERLEGIASGARTAVMCAEGSWRRCHRRLVADALLARGWQVVHLGPRGEREAHEPPGFATIAGGHVTYAAQPALGNGPQRIRAT